jgi:diaminopimelate epimerase
MHTKYHQSTRYDCNPEEDSTSKRSCLLVFKRLKVYRQTLISFYQIDYNGMNMYFCKYHGLGNDYIVLDPRHIERLPDKEHIRRICHRNYGIGSDGILWGPAALDHNDFSVRIFNPDGSEAEKSGNGLRIFARYLLDCGLVSEGNPFEISTVGGSVTARVSDNGRNVSVEMGQVSFDSRKIPVKGNQREVINELLDIDGVPLVYCAATIGNPHCVIIEENLDVQRVKKLGPKIENHPIFPNRTNVQFANVIDRSSIRIEIWERGAGYTLASGSSASATAAVVHRLGLCGRQVSVHMPGGTLNIIIEKDYHITMSGPVVRIGEGKIDLEMFL